jgi:hypothetical protein
MYRFAVGTTGTLLSGRATLKTPILLVLVALWRA